VVGERRLEQALRALECDGVLTAEQLRRHYRCSLKLLYQTGAKTATVPVTATRYGTCVYTVRFVAVEKRLLFLPGTQLRHLAGLGELRHLLNVAPECWSRSEGLVHSKGRPDALWLHGGLATAIEFDAGGYSEKKLAKKMLAFRAWSGDQIWGSASKQHAELIREVAEQTFTEARILVSRWLGKVSH
jgi:hypothetical protein